MLENVLTHPTSHLTGIDIEISPLLRANIEKSGQASRVTLLEGTSQAELRKLPDESFDIIYIDGSHTADDVLADAVMSWQLVRPGGIVIYDDYLWDGSEHTQRGGLAGELTPSPALNAFYSAYMYQIEVAHWGYQLAFRKVANPCGPIKSHCSPFGQYLYDWREGRLLLPAAPPKPVPVTAEERDLIEAILKSRGVGAERQRAYGALRDRIGLHLQRRFDFGSAPASAPAP